MLAAGNFKYLRIQNGFSIPDIIKLQGASRRSGFGVGEEGQHW